MKITSATAALLLSSLIAGAAIAQGPSTPTAKAAPAAAATPAAPAADDDASLLDKHCSSCHSVDQITAASKSADEWAETIDRMIDHGLQITPEDNKRITAFLAAHYGTKAPAK